MENASMQNYSYPTLGSRVAGKRLESADVLIPVENPATGEVLGQLPLLDRAAVQAAAVSAEQAFQVWRRYSPSDRAEILHRTARILQARKSELAWLITVELGKPYQESLREAQTTAELFVWAAEEARRAYGRVIPGRSPDINQYTVYEPIGPVAGFSGWNAPAITPARKISGALAAGCSIVMKPSEATPACALLIADALEEAGLPPGTCNLVFGDAAMVSECLLDDPLIRMLTFTGSTPIGKQLAERAARSLKRMTLELGGYACALIFPDVDVDAVADSAVAAAYRNSGQICTSPTRFLVHESIYERFVERFSRGVSALRVGNGLLAEMQMGPLANARAVSSMQRLVDDARAHGVLIAAGGERIEGPGHFYKPTVLVGLTDDCLAAQHEPFGPVKGISPFKDLDQALALANRLPFGLAAYLWTHDTRVVGAVAGQIEAGALAVNQWSVSLPETPFGGVKDSGQGHEGGIEGVQSFMQMRFVSQKY
jgi:succinate-semialdehyde dehydrogenase/glutarate-semialdehyde dehydrogenase